MHALLPTGLWVQLSTPARHPASCHHTGQRPRQRPCQRQLGVACESEEVKKQQSSWNTTQEGGLEGHDYLFELGRQASNMRTEVGARAGQLDPLFTGGFLGRDSDIASGELRKIELRTLQHLEGDYHIPSAFLDTLGLHVAKNFLKDQGVLGSHIQVPLILGIWGPKGCGKSFSVELCCKLLGMQPIIMSAGELEDEWAGAPGLLIRERYRRAAEVVKNSGKMSCLVINDLDAGCGRFSDTQVTVNNQMVLGTLMNLCDAPTRVSVGKDWRENDVIKRVPIIVTANDLSTLYAPLLRDGRMEKFYWKPKREDLLAMIHRIFRDDGFSEAQLSELMDMFPDQPLDFYGALRARMYDSALLSWVGEHGEEQTPKILRGVARRRYRESAEERSSGEWEHTREFSVDQVDLSQDNLFNQAQDLAQEQQNVANHQLAKEYLRWQKHWQPPKVEKKMPTAAELAEWQAAREKLDTDLLEEISAAEERGTAKRLEREAYEALHPQAHEEPEPEEEPSPWLEVLPDEACEKLVAKEKFTIVDIRSKRDHRRETAKGSVNLPAFITSGTPPNFKTTRNVKFMDELKCAFPEKNSKFIIMGAGSINQGEDEVMMELVESGYVNVAKALGGYKNWAYYYSPNGKRRPPQGKYKTDHFSSGTSCVGSDLPCVDYV